MNQPAKRCGTIYVLRIACLREVNRQPPCGRPSAATRKTDALGKRSIARPRGAGKSPKLGGSSPELVHKYLSLGQETDSYQALQLPTTIYYALPSGRSGRSGPPLVRGDSPRNAPLKHHLDATVRACPHPLARSTGAHRPLQFLATNHYPLGFVDISNYWSARVVIDRLPPYSSSSGIPDSRSEDRRISPCRKSWPSQKSDESEFRQLSTSPGKKYLPNLSPIRPGILPPATPAPTNFPQKSCGSPGNALHCSLQPPFAPAALPQHDTLRPMNHRLPILPMSPNHAERTAALPARPCRIRPPAESVRCPQFRQSPLFVRLRSSQIVWDRLRSV